MFPSWDKEYAQREREHQKAQQQKRVQDDAGMVTEKPKKRSRKKPEEKGKNNEDIVENIVHDQPTVNPDILRKIFN